MYNNGELKWIFLAERDKYSGKAIKWGCPGLKESESLVLIG